MKKALLFYILTFFAYLSITASVIWAIVEFVLYLTKDDPFNWLSLASTVLSFILMIVFLFFASVFDRKHKW